MSETSLVIYHKITDHLALLLTKIEIKNSAGKTDEAGFAENVLGNILSEIFTLALKNANVTNRKPNYPGIDLFDEENKIDVQVTTQNQKFAEKKSLTIEKFLNNADSDQTEILYILFFTRKKIDKTVLQRESIRPNCEYEGFDFRKFQDEISACSHDVQEKILGILDNEYGSFDELDTVEVPNYPPVSNYIERKFWPPGERRTLY